MELLSVCRVALLALAAAVAPKSVLAVLRAPPTRTAALLRPHWPAAGHQVTELCGRYPPRRQRGVLLKEVGGALLGGERSTLTLPPPLCLRPFSKPKIPGELCRSIVGVQCKAVLVVTLKAKWATLEGHRSLTPLSYKCHKGMSHK